MRSRFPFCVTDSIPLAQRDPILTDRPVRLSFLSPLSAPFLLLLLWESDPLHSTTRRRRRIRDVVVSAIWLFKSNLFGTRQQVLREINKMSTQTGRTTVKGNRRRNKRGLNVDLNTPVENPEQIGSSTQAATSQTQPVVFPIDVEAVDDEDDVVFASASAFAEARNKSRRNRMRTSVVVDVESVEQVNPPVADHKRRRVPVSQPVINCEHYVNLESSDSVSEAVAEEQAPPPKEPTFNCPICMGQLVEETSTKCGHIFCKACIREAIATQAKCPTCRKRVTKKDLIRVFLPATSLV